MNIPFWQMFHHRLENRQFRPGTHIPVDSNGSADLLERVDPSMTARIFKPAKNAMQSGHAKTKDWQLDYEPEQPRFVEPLMGWTSSGDMKQQVTLRFEDRKSTRLNSSHMSIS